MIRTTPHYASAPTKKTAPATAPAPFQPKILLPLMIFLFVLTIGLRVDDLWDSFSNQKTFHAIAPSQAEQPAQAEPAKPSGEANKTESKAEPPAPDFKASRDADQKEEEIDPSILRQLKDRRAQIELRAQELDAREALVKVAEERLDQKMKEMETLRTQLQTLVNSANGAQQAQLDNLVKIYETMKAKEAAKIFETLDMPTLLGVVEKMKPGRVAVILAEMAPEKAKDITVALTKKDQLPTLK